LNKDSSVFSISLSPNDSSGRIDQLSDDPNECRLSNSNFSNLINSSSVCNGIDSGSGFINSSSSGGHFGHDNFETIERKYQNDEEYIVIDSEENYYEKTLKNQQRFFMQSHLDLDEYTSTPYYQYQCQNLDNKIDFSCGIASSPRLINDIFATSLSSSSGDQIQYEDNYEENLYEFSTIEVNIPIEIDTQSQDASCYDVRKPPKSPMPMSMQQNLLTSQKSQNLKEVSIDLPLPSRVFRNEKRINLLSNPSRYSDQIESRILNERIDQFDAEVSFTNTSTGSSIARPLGRSQSNTDLNGGVRSLPKKRHSSQNRKRTSKSNYCCECDIIEHCCCQYQEIERCCCHLLKDKSILDSCRAHFNKNNNSNHTITIIKNFHDNSFGLSASASSTSTSSNSSNNKFRVYHTNYYNDQPSVTNLLLLQIINGRLLE
jgi:hypothetical protein